MKWINKIENKNQFEKTLLLLTNIVGKKKLKLVLTYTREWNEIKCPET